MGKYRTTRISESSNRRWNQAPHYGPFKMLRHMFHQVNICCLGLVGALCMQQVMSHMVQTHLSFWNAGFMYGRARVCRIFRPCLVQYVKTNGVQLGGMSLHKKYGISVRTRIHGPYNIWRDVMVFWSHFICLLVVCSDYMNLTTTLSHLTPVNKPFSSNDVSVFWI